MKRRSFLQLIGLTATTPVLAKLPKDEDIQNRMFELTREKHDKEVEDKILKPGDIKRESLRVPPKYGNGMVREVIDYDIREDAYFARYDILTNNYSANVTFNSMPNLPQHKNKLEAQRDEAKRMLKKKMLKDGISKSALIKPPIPNSLARVARYI